MKKITLAFLSLLLISAGLLSQTVTTILDGTPDDAIALDSDGNIYASNFVGDTVFKITQGGEVTSFITGLNTPNGLAFDSLGNLFVCDYSGQAIFKYDSDGNQLDSFPIAGNPSGAIKSFDSDDIIFTNYQPDSINKLAGDGSITIVSNAPELNGPVGLAYDESGVLYVGNFADRKIYRVLENGDLEYIAQLPTEGGTFPNLGFIAYGRGQLWGTVMGNDKIYSVNPNGVDDYSLFAGSTQGGMDGPIAQATFNTPNGILFSADENTMYITDFGARNLRIISDMVLETSDIELKKSELILYPNPATNEVYVLAFLPSAGEYQIVVHDILGREILKLVGNSEFLEISERIDVSEWNSGTYFLQLEFNSHSFTKKIVKN